MTNLILGALFVLYGILTLCARIVKPSLFSKLEKMKQLYGKKLGLIIHFVSYTLLPLAAGGYFLFTYFASQQ